MLIQSPIAWIGDRLDRAFHTVGSASGEEYWQENRQAGAVTVRRIGMGDLGQALTNGLADFAANRTDVVFLCVIYPLVGLVLARLASGYGVVPLLFPLASGFALVGPLAAVGLNEMSRRRELGGEVTWIDAFGVLRSPSIGPIIGLGLLLIAIFLLWMVTAEAIYVLTLGPKPPVSIAAFAHDVFTTASGWTMIVLGVGIGFLFALLTLAISVVSFPLLLDRDVKMETAVWTSIQAVVANPLPMAAWGVIVTAGLVIGSIPCLLGLVIVMPVLGHATWHLYRRVVAR
ncbi:MAG TPA: DUF2189 domain-containing protein [Acetobacteraceae bacterium]|jgi:uncharacterized membrane protein|nr:DUF2189 domain-containing protein [Acetobacteraceae bacterium]